MNQISVDAVLLWRHAFFMGVNLFLHKILNSKVKDQG